MFGEVPEDGVQCIVVQVSVLLTTMMIEVDEILNVVVWTNVLNMLKQNQNF